MSENDSFAGCKCRFDQWQYDFLKQCSEKREEGIREWNQWREQNPTKDICLDEQDFHGWYLRGVNLMQARTCDVTGEKTIDYSGQIYLRKAHFDDADAQNCHFTGAHLEATCWWYANLRGSDFTSARLNDAELGVSRLGKCRFDSAVLNGAHLSQSSLRGATFMQADLTSCQALTAIVDGATILWGCRIDRQTDFTGVGLENIRIDPATKQLLQYNIRRKNWEGWYREHSKVQWLARAFWWFSDYGLSTKRIVVVFFLSALAFGVLYYLSALLSPSGFVSSVFQGKEGPVPGWLAPIRAICYSIVTMTTLGFGGIDANCRSLWGHALLMLQSLLGYVLLGALVTRFAVLFTAGGPPGKFAQDER